MSISPSQRGQLAKKAKRLVAARTAAEEAVFVFVFEAAEAGASQADIAYMIGDKGGSTIKAKALKGKAILEDRRRT
jgi:hypothetical protein